MYLAFQYGTPLTGVEWSCVPPAERQSRKDRQRRSVALRARESGENASRHLSPGPPLRVRIDLCVLHRADHRLSVACTNAALLGPDPLACHPVAVNRADSFE